MPLHDAWPGSMRVDQVDPLDRNFEQRWAVTQTAARQWSGRVDSMAEKYTKTSPRVCTLTVIARA